jgi:copper chaperone CopZ
MLWLILVAAAWATSNAEAATPQTSDHQVQIVAPGIGREGVARKVSGQLNGTAGVKAVDVEMKTFTVTVSVSRPRAATLGRLWQAVEKGEGDPLKLATSEASYTLVRLKDEADPSRQAQKSTPTLQIFIDNLHCKGCARKIAAQLYVLKGVTKVSVDMPTQMMAVETRPGTSVSPWLVIDAVVQANERPLAVIGAHGRLSIEWAAKRAPKTHQQAQQAPAEGIQR